MTREALIAASHARGRHPGLLQAPPNSTDRITVVRNLSGELMVFIDGDGNAYDRDDRPGATARVRRYRPDGSEVLL